MRHEWAVGPESRYGIYRLVASEPAQVVTCGEDDIGFTLVTLRAEGDLLVTDRVGILDGETGDWLVNPYGNGRTSPIGM